MNASTRMPRRAVQSVPALQRSLRVGAANDPLETEADAVAERVLRMPAAPDAEGIRRCPGGCPGEEVLRRRPTERRAGGASADLDPGTAASIRSVRSGGEPLQVAVRDRFEPRFGADFSAVRVHADHRAAGLAAAVNARAFTVGRDVYFGGGEYRPGTAGGDRLLAHELAHTLQQGGEPQLRRALYTCEDAEDCPSREPGERAWARTTGLDAAHIDSPEAGFLVWGLPIDSADMTGIDSVPRWAPFWGDMVTRNAVWRVRGFTDCLGDPATNAGLREQRATNARDALPRYARAKVLSAVGAPLSECVAGNATREERAFNRSALFQVLEESIEIEEGETVTGCPLPHRLGAARGCGSGADFAHFDHPSISASSEAKLAAWAMAHGSPHRSMVPDFRARSEMSATLAALGGSPGLDVYARFSAGTGGTLTWGPSSSLGSMALASGSFARTVSSVQASIESQLAAQASAGDIDACGLSVTPPATHFEFSDGTELKAVIGGTQGEELFITALSADPSTRRYTARLRFVICDDFGVDESDLYAPGLMAFWVLQHERSATRYAPFINELELPVTISGSF